MPDDDAFFEVDDRLRDTGGVIGNSFKMTPDTHQLEPGVELPGIAAERVFHLAAEPAIAAINRAIAVDQRPRALRVSPGEGVVAGASLIEDIARRAFSASLEPRRLLPSRGPACELAVRSAPPGRRSAPNRD